MNLCAFIQMYNEVEKGNLVRCLENAKQWADEICIYDDASTDNSVEVASRYTPHVIRGEKNAIIQELFHKQQLLEYALTLKPDWIMWIDCDEIMDRPGTTGGLRQLADNAPPEVDAYSFNELNLWRSQTFARADSLFASGWFVRLWRVTPEISIRAEAGVHLRLYPITIKNVVKALPKVIHYGFWDYKKMMVKIGAHFCDRDELRRIAPDNWILNETTCACYRVPDATFPVENVPVDVWPKPRPLKIHELVPYLDVPEQPLTAALAGRNGIAIWAKRHIAAYHGGYEQIAARNRRSYIESQHPHPNSMFQFDPKGKTIVDVGCGGGWYGLYCLAKGAKKVYCVENNREVIALAKRSFHELNVPKEAYAFICLEDTPADLLEQVDVVMCMAVFMHIPIAEVRAYLAWIRDILAPGGEAHLQFHQQDGKTLFNSNGESGCAMTIPDASVDMLFAEARLAIKEKQYPRADSIVPVWTFYVAE